MAQGDKVIINNIYYHHYSDVIFSLIKISRSFSSF